jgi:hypothetical protein
MGWATIAAGAMSQIECEPVGADDAHADGH